MPKSAKSESGKEVELSTLETLQLFKFQGELYTKRRDHPGSITCLSKKGDKLITLSPDTLVTPIEVKPKIEEVSPKAEAGSGEGEPGAEEPGAEADPELEEPGAEEPEDKTNPEQ